MKLLPNKEEPEVKRTFKLDLKPFLIGVLILVVILLGLYYFIIYRNSSNVLKRALIKEEYTCKGKRCTKTYDNVTYTVYYKNGTIIIDDLDYQITTSNNNVTVQNRNTKLTCLYYSEETVIGKTIDDKFTYSPDCSKYIDNTNKLLKVYNEILESSKVNISKLKK